MVTVYRCPILGCLWQHVDGVVPCIPGWEDYSEQRHSFESQWFKGNELRDHYLTVELVLYAHLDTHTSHQWVLTLRAMEEHIVRHGKDARHAICTTVWHEDGTGTDEPVRIYPSHEAAQNALPAFPGAHVSFWDDNGYKSCWRQVLDG